MASRAHAIHDYDYDHDVRHGSERPRRQVSYRSSEDPIEIPRGHNRDGGGLAIAVSALIASSVILGGAYAIYVGPPPAMAATPALPLYPTWQRDDQPQKAELQRALQGPALAVPNAGPAGTLEEQVNETPVHAAAPAVAPGARGPSGGSPEVIIDDRYQLPQPALQAPQMEPAPYPDPIKTPPDGVGPSLDLDAPTPALDPENPYRETEP
jgi:hypothetical protein